MEEEQTKALDLVTITREEAKELVIAQGGWSPILLFFSVRLLLNHDKNTSSNPHFLLLLYIQNILVKSIQFGWCFYSIPYNEKMWVTAGVFVMI